MTNLNILAARSAEKVSSYYKFQIGDKRITLFCILVNYFLITNMNFFN